MIQGCLRHETASHLLMHSLPPHTQKIKKFIVHITEKKQSRASRAEGSESEQLHQGWGETGSLESLPTDQAEEAMPLVMIRSDT